MGSVSGPAGAVSMTGKPLVIQEDLIKAILSAPSEPTTESAWKNPPGMELSKLLNLIPPQPRLLIRIHPDNFNSDAFQKEFGAGRQSATNPNIHEYPGNLTFYVTDKEKKTECTVIDLDQARGGRL